VDIAVFVDLIGTSKTVRGLTAAGLLLLMHATSYAAQPCPTPAYAPRTTQTIVDWHDTYLRPARMLAGADDGTPVTVDQVDTLISKLATLHRNSWRESLLFEALMRQLSDYYQKSHDFRGLDTLTAGRIYRRGSGAELDFTLMCIDARTSITPDDTVAVTLFGMNQDDCRHIGLRGLVFTGALINGSVNGECRPDHVYYRRIIIPVAAGTNAITFLCRKDVGGCMRQ
jgi:hypothetical protein